MSKLIIRVVLMGVWLFLVLANLDMFNTIGFVAFIFCLFGASLNFICIVSNRGMPVKSKEPIESKDKFYFNFKDRKKIWFPHLADIFPFELNFKKFSFSLTFSIGDIIITSGLIAMIWGFK